MTEIERLRYFRKKILNNLTQADFGSTIGLSATAIGQMEAGARNITERTRILLKEKYNLNINWLQTGEGTPIIEPDVFSLDEYVKSKGMTEEELEIVKCCLELDPAIRKTVIEHFKEYFGVSGPPIAATIEEKVEGYRRELEAEVKGEVKSLASRTESGAETGRVG